MLKEQKIEDQKVSQLLQVSRATLYRWQKQLKKKGLMGLANKSRKPHRARQSLWWGTDIMEGVLDLRVQFPAWGKDKLATLLNKQGVYTSSSTVGRILKVMKRLGALGYRPKYLSKNEIFKHKRIYAPQRSKDYVAKIPGDLIQIDAMNVKLLNGKKIKHFTAQDVVSRWNVLEVYQNANYNSATDFLASLLSRMPFKVKAIQVDGGREYYGKFELACKQLGIKLFVLPPFSPRLNGQVERAHRTHLEEFYFVQFRKKQSKNLIYDLHQWEYVYNNIRPHQSLGFLSPAEYLDKEFSQSTLNKHIK